MLTYVINRKCKTGDVHHGWMRLDNDEFQRCDVFCFTNNESSTMKPNIINEYCANGLCPSFACVREWLRSWKSRKLPALYQWIWKLWLHENSFDVKVRSIYWLVFEVAVKRSETVRIKLRKIEEIFTVFRLKNSIEKHHLRVLNFWFFGFFFYTALRFMAAPQKLGDYIT